MKREIIAITALAALTLGATAAFGWTAGRGGIVGSRHDMNMFAGTGGLGVTADPQGRVCAFCHTPHHKLPDAGTSGGTAAVTYNPLWSHVIDGANYSAYHSRTFDGGTNAPSENSDPLVGPSRLCMSCHDGVIAVDEHYGIAGTASGGILSSTDFGGIAIGDRTTSSPTVSTTHPIGFEITGIHAKFPGIRANLNAPNNTALHTQPIESLGFNDGTTTWFTCASCHDVHNKDDVVQDSTTAWSAGGEGRYFLYEKQNGSAICLMCHDK